MKKKANGRRNEGRSQNQRCYWERKLISKIRNSKKVKLTKGNRKSFSRDLTIEK